MLCESHKDKLLKGGSRALALAGCALVALGAATVRVVPSPAAAPVAMTVRETVDVTLQPKEVAAPTPAVRRREESDDLRATVSLYERTVKQSALRRQGCDAAERGAGGVVILAWGQPAYNGRTYGTNLFSGRFASNRDITEAMLAYAVGYRNCLPAGSKLSISLARGTSNYHPQVPSAYQAGKRWARETKKLQGMLEARGLSEHVTSAAADDVEPAWDRSFRRTRDFFRGYRDLKTGHVLYNFGSLDGGVGRIWNARQMFFVASGMKYVAAIPQIYNDAMAKQWAELAKLAKSRYNRPLKIAGIMTQRTSRNKAMKPTDAHQTLIRALQSVGSPTAVPQTLTNIRFAAD